MAASESGAGRTSEILLLACCSQEGSRHWNGFARPSHVDDWIAESDPSAVFSDRPPGHRRQKIPLGGIVGAASHSRNTKLDWGLLLDVGWYFDYRDVALLVLCDV